MGSYRQLTLRKFPKRLPTIFRELFYIWCLVTLVLNASLVSASAQSRDNPMSMCSALVDQAVSRISSAATNPDSFDRTFQSLQELREPLATTCTAAAKNLGSDMTQCEHAGGKWDAGQQVCQNFTNSKVAIFGGTVDQVTFCWNEAIYLRLADGTEVVWTGETQTFKLGAASRVTDFVFGLTDKPYYCVAQKVPMLVWSGTHIKAMVHRPYHSDDEARSVADRAGARSRHIDEISNKILLYTAEIQAAPHDLSALAKRGITYLAKADYPAAIADFDEIIASRPSDAGAWSNRCWARAAGNQQLDLALGDANEALRLKPTTAEALNCRGLIYLRMGRLDEAVTDYNAILGIPPELYKNGTGNWDIASAWYGRGMAEQRRHNDIAAILDFAAATAVAPTIANTFAGYGFGISDRAPIYGQQIGDMNSIEMAPHFDSFVAEYYRALAERKGRVTASKLTSDSISGMLEAAAINPSDVDTRSICGTAPSAWSDGRDETSKSLSCFFLVLHHAAKRFGPEQDPGKYKLLIRGAIYGLKKSAIR